MRPSESKENEEATRLLTLVVTNRCNLDCVYCFVGKKGDRSMPFEIALNAVNKHLNSDSEAYRRVKVDFTGGEPLMNFPLIRDVVDYVLSKKWRKEYSFSIGTNGTLITSDIRKWSDQHPCVSFGLSFDGIKEVQDLNRSGSYDTVVRNIDFFRKWSDGKVKMTIGPESIHQVAASVIHAHELGMNVAANVVFEDVWGDRKAEYLRIFDRELSKLIEFYLENPGLEPPYLLNMPIESLLYPEQGHRRFCGSGKNMVTVDLDGAEYPCHRFLPMSSDNPESNPDLRIKTVGPEKCENCILAIMCPTCLAYNYECHSDVDHRTTFHCEFVALQALASAKLKYLELKREVAANPPDRCDPEKGAEIKRTIESIRLILGARSALQPKEKEKGSASGVPSGGSRGIPSRGIDKGQRE